MQIKWKDSKSGRSYASIYGLGTIAIEKHDEKDFRIVYELMYCKNKYGGRHKTLQRAKDAAFDGLFYELLNDSKQYYAIVNALKDVLRSEA